MKGRGFKREAASAVVSGYARDHRRNPTEPELRLWRHLSGSKRGGFKFRRQYVSGSRILDFFCPAIALAVEVDGHTHDADTDFVADGILKTAGITTIRVSNYDVMTNMEGTLLSILSVAQTCPARWKQSQ
nr:endonuclease domain-containing protein [Sphingomonas sp. BT552]